MKQPESSSSPISNMLEDEGKKEWWWHRLTVAPEVRASTTTAAQREAYRQARLVSSINFALIVVVCLLIPATLFIPNHYVILACCGMLGICLLAALITRANRARLAGMILVAMLEAALLAVIASTLPFDVPNLPLYDLLLMVELFAASLLPPGFIIGTALLNVLFIIAHLYLLRSGFGTPALQQYLHTQFYAALIRPAALEIIVAVVATLWVRSTTQAIKRANRAELIARLEHTLAQQKEQLDYEIQQILQTHTEIANGNLDARSPLTRGQALWPLANALNTLLSRHQRLVRVEQQQKRLEQALLALTQTLYEAEVRQQALPAFPQTSTQLDPILKQLSNKQLGPAGINTRNRQTL